MSSSSLTSQGYLEQARRYARLSFEATFQGEREGYHQIAVGYLALAKSAAYREQSRVADWDALSKQMELLVWSKRRD